MSGYQVLARRWRPQKFSDLVGQDVVVRTLSSALESGQVAHAYLFSGLRGVGKTTVARLLAKALNCEQGPAPEPCGECVPCREITAGSTLDVLEIDAASTRGIDDVRELRDIARNQPLRDRYRVFILDEAHQITKDAFGALLKVLEEPPPYLVFILASTDKQKFPATILSRCLQVDFRPIPSEVIVARLQTIAEAEGFSLASGAAEAIARAAEGSLRDALSLLDRVLAFAGAAVEEDSVAEVLGLPPVEVVLGLGRTLVAGDAPGALAMVREQERQGRDAGAMYEQVVQLFHSLLLLSCDAKAAIPFPEERRQEMAAMANEVGTPLLLRLAHLALDQRALLASADRPWLAAAVVIGRLALWPRLRRVEEWLQGDSGVPDPVGPGAPQAPDPAPTAAGGATSPLPTEGSGPPSSTEPGGSVLERLAQQLERGGAAALAARLRRAREARVEGDRLVVTFSGAPKATVEAVQSALPEVAAAAREADLPAAVTLENDTAGQGGDNHKDSLRRQVEQNPGVQRVLEVFGGRIDRVRERP